MYVAEPNRYGVSYRPARPHFHAQVALGDYDARRRDLVPSLDFTNTDEPYSAQGFVYAYNGTRWPTVLSLEVDGGTRAMERMQPFTAMPCYDPEYFQDFRLARFYTVEVEGELHLLGQLGVPLSALGTWWYAHRAMVPLRDRLEPGKKTNWLRNSVGRWNKFHPSCLLDEARFFRPHLRENGSFDTHNVRSLADVEYLKEIREVLEAAQQSTTYQCGWICDERLLVLPPQLERHFRFRPRPLGYVFDKPTGSRYSVAAIRSYHEARPKWLRASRRHRQETGYLLTADDHEATKIKPTAFPGRYVPMPEGWSAHLAPAEGFHAYEMSPMLFYLPSMLIKFRLGEAYVWQVVITETVVLIAVEWLRQAYDRLRLWWLPQFVEEQLRGLGDEALRRPFGNARNVSDFWALLARRDELLENVYENDWANVPEEYRGGFRGDTMDNYEPGRQGKGGDFIPFAWFEDRLIQSAEEATFYYDNMPRNLPADQAREADWGATSSDYCYLDLKDPRRARKNWFDTIPKWSLKPNYKYPCLLYTSPSPRDS